MTKEQFFTIQKSMHKLFKHHLYEVKISEVYEDTAGNLNFDLTTRFFSSNDIEILIPYFNNVLLFHIESSEGSKGKLVTMNVFLHRTRITK